VVHLPVPEEARIATVTVAPEMSPPEDSPG
jgi:hypothetical protein